MFYIYKITNKINNKIYIGKSKHPHTRWKVHKTLSRGDSSTYSGRQHYFHKAIKKYGEENFHFEIIDNCELESIAFEKESFYIEKYKTNIVKYGKNTQGYNLTDGGEGPTGYKHTDEAKQKMSQNHNYKYGEEHHLYGTGHAEETKRRMSDEAIASGKSVGNKNPMFGKTGILSPGYGRKGDKHPNTKISDFDLIILKQEIKSGNFTLQELADKYGVSIALISNIKNNKRRS
jgi:group I intron endonuclease